MLRPKLFAEVPILPSTELLVEDGGSSKTLEDTLFSSSICDARAFPLPSLILKDAGCHEGKTLAVKVNRKQKGSYKKSIRGKPVSRGQQQGGTKGR